MISSASLLYMIFIAKLSEYQAFSAPLKGLFISFHPHAIQNKDVTHGDPENLLFFQIGFVHI